MAPTKAPLSVPADVSSVLWSGIQEDLTIDALLDTSLDVLMNAPPAVLTNALIAVLTPASPGVPYYAPLNPTPDANGRKTSALPPDSAI